VGLPTELSARISRNTQILVQEESHICDVVDPLGGSYYVETLTQNIIDEVRNILVEIQELGGMARAIESGMPKMRIEAVAARRQARIDTGKDVIVGVNKYRMEDEIPIPVREVSEDVREEQVARLTQIKKQRDNNRVQRTLADITTACESGDNLLAACLPAVRARATIGEICDAMEKVFKRFVATTQCISGVYAAESPDSEIIASLRQRTADFKDKTGRRPRILLCKMGQDGHDRGVKVIATAFADFGFDVDLGPMFQTPAEAARMAVENDVHVVGVSSLAAGHKTLVPQVIAELKNQGASDIRVVVGGIIPPGDYDFLKTAGAADIFGPGTVVTDAANRTLNMLGA
jgi:methylmalonyl-CoA mutase